MSLSRRIFIRTSATAAAVGSMPWLIPTKVRGANEQMRIGLAGCGGRGSTHVAWIKEEAGNAKLVCISDPDKAHMAKYAEKAAKDKKNPAEYEQIQDYRKMLERKDLDVITIATPNHYHSLMAIQAILAGKDVYVEKPISHTVWEGRQLVNAARKHGKIVQTGAQSRSQLGTQEMVKYLRSGAIGKMKHIVATCYKPRPPIGKRTSPLPVADSIDYDLWCGPVAKVDLFRDELHYDWHWDFNTGNGDLGNQGVHEMDRARWFAGHDTLSPRVFSLGGRFGPEDAGNTPNTQIVYHDYPTVPILFEVRGMPRSKEFQDDKQWKGKMDSYTAFGTNVAAGFSTVVVYCENGTLISSSYNAGKAIDKEGKTLKTFQGSGAHWGNFADAVRARKRQMLTNNELEGHLSAGLCNTGNVSYRLGRKMKAGDIRDQVKANASMLERFNSIMDHCKANGVDIDSPTIALGPVLEMDVKTERFTNNDEANKLLRRIDRKGFEVPEITA